MTVALRPLENPSSKHTCDIVYSVLISHPYPLVRLCVTLYLSLSENWPIIFCSCHSQDPSYTRC